MDNISFKKDSTLVKTLSGYVDIDNYFLEPNILASEPYFVALHNHGIFCKANISKFGNSDLGKILVHNQWKPHCPNNAPNAIFLSFYSVNADLILFNIDGYELTGPHNTIKLVLFNASI